MTRRAEITVTINDQTVMCWFSLIVKDVARGVEPHVMWWLLEGIEPSSDSRLSPVARLGGAAVERNGRKNDHLEPATGHVKLLPGPVCHMNERMQSSFGTWKPWQ